MGMIQAECVTILKEGAGSTSSIDSQHLSLKALLNRMINAQGQVFSLSVLELKKLATLPGFYSQKQEKTFQNILRNQLI